MPKKTKYLLGRPGTFVNAKSLICRFFFGRNSSLWCKRLKKNFCAPPSLSLFLWDLYHGSTKLWPQISIRFEIIPLVLFLKQFHIFFGRGVDPLQSLNFGLYSSFLLYALNSSNYCNFLTFTFIRSNLLLLCME